MGLKKTVCEKKNQTEIAQVGIWYYLFAFQKCISGLEAPGIFSNAVYLTR
jgi:hypothetical protein